MKKTTSTTTTIAQSHSQKLRHELLEHLDPNSVDILLIMFSVCCSLMIKSSTVIGLMILGEPGVGKTTLLRCMEQLPMALWKQKITAASVAPAKENSDPADALVNQIPEKCLMIPEMGPIFSDKKIFPVIASLMDGNGYSVASGNGLFGATGPIKWTCIGCKPDLSSANLRDMGMVGPRFTSVRFPVVTETDAENAERLAELYLNSSYNETLQKVGEILDKHYTIMETVFPDNIIWNRSLDSKDALVKIATLSKLIARSRVHIHRVKKEISEMPKPEDNKRLFQQLIDTTRGYASIDLRNYIQMSDLKVPLRIALDSMPYDRSELLYDLIDCDGTITSEEFISRRFKRINGKCSTDFCRRRFDDMVASGVCSEIKVKNGKKKGFKAITLNPTWIWIIDYYKSLTAA